MLRRAGLILGLVVGLGATATAQGPSGPTASPVTGQRISLDLKGVDILDVLKLLSQKSGLNFVAGRNVTGRVTIFATDVDVWEAFELIIGANDLAYERRGDLITVMNARDYELLYGEKFQERKQDVVFPLEHAKVVQVATVLNQIKSSVGRVVADEASNTLIVSDAPGPLAEMRSVLEDLDRPTETRVHTLNYTDAEALKEKVQELLSPIGTFSVDARTNKVVVTDLPEIVQRVDRIVRAFDIPDGEVLIEAKIIKVELTDETSLGIDWQELFETVKLRGRSNFRLLSDIVDGTATGGALKLDRGEVDIVLEALRTIGKTDTLSNPRIMVSNNEEAKILVGTKEAFVTVTTTVPTTGSVVSSPEIEFVDVGTKLFVTPSIKRNGYVQLKVRPEVSTASVTTFQDNRIPIVTTTEAETSVLVKSGVTLVIGGLIDSKESRTDSRVPVLGKLPVVGAMFRSVNEKDTRTELVIFLTPEIILPSGERYEAPEVEGPLADESLPTVILEAPVPADYHERIRKRLEGYLAKHFRTNRLPVGSVVIAFVLSHDGRVLALPKITSPQGEAFVRAATAALQEAVPFPPFPEGSRATEVRFRIAVEHAP